MASGVGFISFLLFCMAITGSEAGWDPWDGWDWYELTGKDHHFHCQRFNQACKNGGYCYDYDSGYCYCPVSSNGEEFFGYDCSINVTEFPEVGAVEEGCPCQNTDVCYRGADGESLFCVCPPDYFGKDCSENRVKVSCSADSMLVLFNPIEPFTGIAYFGNDSSREECHLHDYDYEQYRFSRYKDFDENNGDNCDLTVSTNRNGDYSSTSYTRQLSIQYDPIFESGLDLILDITCNHLENGTWVTEGVFGAARDSTSQKGEEIESTYFPVVLGIWDSWYDWDDDPSAETVFLGQYIYLINKLTSNTKYRKLYVESCTFSHSGGEKRMTVIEDGCPTDRFQGMVKSIYTEVEYTAFRFRAIRFGTDPVVRVSCMVRLCKDENDTSNCPEPDCFDDDDDERKKRDVGDMVKGRRRRRRRRKRQTEVTAENERTVSNTFMVIEPNEQHGIASQVTAEECMSEPVVKTVGISLLASLLVLVLVCIGLALCLCRLGFSKREMALKLRSTNDGLSHGHGNEGFQIGCGDNLKSKGM